MEYPFSSDEMGTGYWPSPRARVDGMDMTYIENGARSLNSNMDGSFTNIAELMNADLNGGWCTSPNNFSDHSFPYFAMSPHSSTITNFASFNGMNFTEQYSPGVPMADGDTVGSFSSTEDKMMLQQMHKQLYFTVDSANGGVDVSKRRGNNSSSQQNTLAEIGQNTIPRLPLQTLAEKLLRALYLFRELSGGEILAQVWVPMKNRDGYILSTSEQPYLLDQTLSGYREVSRFFTFGTESSPGSFPGLPGRVFTSKMPEWTSDVVYYNKEEYLRVQYAVDHKVRGSVALPVFEDYFPEKSCAVLELVTTKEKPNFDSEMENVCRALQAVNLRSAVPRLSPQFLSKNQRAALAEITDVLRAVCHAHRLPLALTWIPCSYNEGTVDETTRVQVRGSNTSSDEKCILCIESTACYVNDAAMQGFLHACKEHHLQEGQGTAGKALQSNHPFFYPDVKEYHISEFPLVHHARKFGLNAAVAIRLRSTYTGDNDYILELFLPVNIKGSTEQQLLLNNLSSTMQRICRSLRTVSDAELLGLENKESQNFPPSTLSRRSSEQSLVDGKLNSADQVTLNVSDSKDTRMDANGPLDQTMAGPRGRVEKKRSTAEKHVSLSVLQKYFSGSLKDAAKSIGVCPTTLKRICRQHGISRWPSRKINKVNRSLRKIQSVLDSVQGVEGGLKYDTKTGEVVAASSIQNFDHQEGIFFHNGSQSTINPDSVIQGAIPTPPSCTDLESAVVKMEELEGCFVEKNKVAELNNSMKPEASEYHFSSRSAISTVARDDAYTRFKSDTAMDGGAVLENDQPTTSGMSDSSNTSTMKGSSSSSRSYDEKKSSQTEVSCGEIGSKITVKATYKEDTVRFKFERSAGCLQLYEEIALRFKLNTGQFQIKYLDDEEEWVLLVSDYDLQECLEILDFVGTRSVKILVRGIPCPVGSSGGSNYFTSGVS